MRLVFLLRRKSVLCIGMIPLTLCVRMRAIMLSAMVRMFTVMMAAFMHRHSSVRMVQAARYKTAYTQHNQQPYKCAPNYQLFQLIEVIFHYDGGVRSKKGQYAVHTTTAHEQDS